MKDKIIKGTTLLLFASLIAGFVAYRSGYFGGGKSAYSISPNRSALNNQLDTISKNDSLKRTELMYSSKSLIIKDNPIQSADSLTISDLDSLLKRKLLMSTSKSGTIFDPKDSTNKWIFPK